MEYLSKQMLLKGNIKEFKGNMKDKSQYNYIYEYKNKQYLVQRVGECKPKKCKSACCKFMHTEYNLDYTKNFGKLTKSGVILPLICSQLNTKCDTCKLWDKKLPKVCNQFPHPSDRVYYEVYDKCSFKFKILFELKKLKK